MKKKITIGYYAAFIALGLAVAAAGPTLPGLADQTHSTLDDISIIFTSRSFGFLLGALLVGRLYDRFPGHRIMGTALMLMALFLALIPFVPALWALTAVIFFLGLVEPGVDVGGNTLIVWLHKDKVAPFMNGLHFFFGIGALLSPFIIAWMISGEAGITRAYWLLAVLVLLPAFFIGRLPSPPPPAPSHTELEGTQNRLLILLIALFFFLYAGVEIAFGGWIFTYATTLGLTTARAAAVLTSVFWGSLTLGRVVGIPLSTRFRNRTIIFGDLIGSMLSLSLIILFPASSAVLWLATFGFGFAMASVFPAILSLAEKHMDVRGRTTSYFFVGVSLGAMTIPWLIGQIFVEINPETTMAALAFFLLLATAVFTILVRWIQILEAKKQKSDTPIEVPLLEKQ